MAYSAALFAPDGDYVIDYHCDTIEQVQEMLADQGSRWYFYPFHAVIVDHAVTTPRNRVVDAAWPFEHLTGKTIGTFARTIAEIPEKELEAILSC